MARADLKQGRAGGRTPFEVLDDFRWTGDTDDLIVWREYERATKGRQAITWSKGLRQLLTAADRTDEEIAVEEIGGEDLAVIHGDDWRHIVRVPGLAALILDHVERGRPGGRQRAARPSWCGPGAFALHAPALGVS